MKVLSFSFTLNNGVMIPCLGFGTAPLKGEEAYQATIRALKVGYRHIDTAAIYLNEEAVGKAIKDVNMPREELFITSKLDASIKTYEGALKAFDESLEKLGLDYLDLYLIHAPWPWEDPFTDHRSGNVAAYKALEKLYADKRVRAIGVSNFSPDDIENILTHCEITPHVNQIKYHIGHRQKETVDYCLGKEMLIEAYSPLGKGLVLNHPEIVSVAKTYNVTAAQLCLRFALQNNTLPLPRSKDPDRIKINTELDFSISPSDMIRLNSLILKENG